MTTDDTNNTEPGTPIPEVSTERLQKIQRSFSDEPHWRLLIGDIAVKLTTSQLCDRNKCWKKVAKATHLRVFNPFRTWEEHRAWAQSLLDEVEEVSE